MNSSEIYDIFASDQLLDDNIWVIWYDHSPETIEKAKSLQMFMNASFHQQFSLENL